MLPWLNILRHSRVCRLDLRAIIAFLSSAQVILFIPTVDGSFCAKTSASNQRSVLSTVGWSPAESHTAALETLDGSTALYAWSPWQQTAGYRHKAAASCVSAPCLRTEGCDTGAHQQRHILTFLRSTKIAWGTFLSPFSVACHLFNGYLRLHFITGAGHRRRLLSAGFK